MRINNAEQGGKLERRLGRNLKSNVLGRRRVTLFVICRSKMVSYKLQAELYECTGTHNELVNAVSALFPFDFTLTCRSPRNNYQLISNFDDAFCDVAQNAGWKRAALTTPDGFFADHDGYFEFEDHHIVVEIEKANWQKFLFDLLKCHVYVSSGANGCLIVLPVNWPHAHGIKDIYHDCLPRLNLARDYGAIRTDVLNSLVVVGFRQLYNGCEFNAAVRSEMRAECQREIGT